jgi:MFS family permease
VPSQDLGDLGPKEGAPAIYHWRWYHSAPRVALWVLLILAIVLVKANRNARALLILVPLFVVNLLWLGLRKVVGFPSTSIVVFDQLIVSLTLSITLLWLLAHKLDKVNRFITFLLAVGVMAALGLLAAVSYGGLELTEETVLLAILFAVFAVAMLVAFALAGWSCRKRYSPVGFMLWLLVWTVAAGVVAMFSYVAIAVVVSTMSGSSSGPTISMLLEVLLVGAVFGLCLYVIDLPYMLLVPKQASSLRLAQGEAAGFTGTCRPYPSRLAG